MPRVVGRLVSQSVSYLLFVSTQKCSIVVKVWNLVKLSNNQTGSQTDTCPSSLTVISTIVADGVES